MGIQTGGPGFSYGATDEFGLHAIEARMHTTDLHATLLALMRLDHEQLTYRYGGRDFRLTDATRELRTCLQKALTGLQFGQLVLIVHDGQVTRVEMNEKVRLYNSR